MHNRLKALAAFLLVMSFAMSAQCIDLSGDWNAKLSSGREGNVKLPGTLDMAGLGEPNNLKAEMEKPQLLRLTRKTSYVGPCEYSRIIDIPADMAGKRLRLSMERVLWKSTLKIDGKPLSGENISLNSPHYFEIPPLGEGRHRIEITVDNRPQRDISVNNLCHSYTDDTQTIWNGILGKISLCVVPDIELGKMNVYPDIKNQSISVCIDVDNKSGRKEDKKIILTVTEKSTGRVVGTKTSKYSVPLGASVFKTALSLDSPTPWSEFFPEVYKLDARTDDSSVATTFGMREIASQDKNILVNGKKIFLRGTLDCCVFPLTGVPPTDKEGWAKEMATLKEWGFNHIRFHSWCPPEAAFEMADSLGIYLHTELPVWSLKIGDDPEVTDFLRKEFKNMSDSYGNHPSWIMSTCGNELQHDFNTLNTLVEEMRRLDPRHIYAATSFTFEKGHGGHAEPNDQFLVTQWTDDGWVRGQGVFDSEEPSFDKDYSQSMGCVEVPLVSHEIGQYAVYPDPREIDKYTGVLDPLNFKAIRDDLKAKGLLHKADDFLKATSGFAKILYKEEIERALKTPGFSGFQLLGIQDFPGQGTALVGLLDVFWDAKGKMKGRDFRKFNSPVTPLASFGKAVYTTDETFLTKVLLSNFGESDITGKTVEWTLSDSEGTCESGTIGNVKVPQGEVAEIGEIRASLGRFHAPSKLTLSISLPDTDYDNSWNVWLYPVAGEASDADVLVTSDLNEAKKALAKEGGKVLYMPDRSKINGIESKFLPVFWSPVHFPKQAGGMGILADASHPALKGFPNDGRSDWQWWRPVKNARIMNLDSIADKNTGKNIEPVVGVIDNFYKNRRLGYMLEAKCGRGSIFVSSIDLDLDAVEVKALRKSILEYLESGDFNPKDEISFETLESITTTATPIDKTNATSIYE